MNGVVMSWSDDLSRIVGVTDWNRRLMDVTPINLNAALGHLGQWLDSHKVDGVCLRGFDKLKLDFLCDYKDLTVLEVKDCTNVCFRALEKLPNISSLGLGDGDRKEVVNVDGLYALKEIYGDWGKGILGVGNLKHLRLVKFIGSKVSQLKELDLPCSIEELQLVRGRVRVLNGCGEFVKLKRIRLCGLSELVSLDEIGLVSDLEHAEFELLKKVSDFWRVGKCKKLVSLNLIGNGSIDSIDWVSNLNNLESLGINRTNILDGDLRAVANLPRLRFFSCDRRKNYDPNPILIMQLVKTRQRDQPDQGLE